MRFHLIHHPGIAFSNTVKHQYNTISAIFQLFSLLICYLGARFMEVLNVIFIWLGNDLDTNQCASNNDNICPQSPTGQSNC